MIEQKRKRRVAVFDIDGTLFRSSLLIELVEALILEKIFPAAIRSRYGKAYRNWLERRGGYEKYIAGVVRAFEGNIRGVREKDLVRVAGDVIAFHQNRLYRYTRDLLKGLKRRRYYLLAISHSPRYVVNDFAVHLGFDKIYGRLLELDRRERFTGRILNEELINDKAKILLRAVRKENLTLKGSVGVGDTESDIPFLKLVERPICFNPNQPLYRAAKRNHWPVVVERKDVIYSIRN